MAYTLGDLGQFDEAYAKFDEVPHLLGDKLHSVRASVRELMCVVYLWQGRWAEAQEAGFEGSDIALRCRSRYLTAMGRALGACGAWAMKKTSFASFNLLHESTQWIDARGGAVSTSLNHGWLVDASVTLGMEREARQSTPHGFSCDRVPRIAMARRLAVEPWPDLQSNKGMCRAHLGIWIGLTRRPPTGHPSGSLQSTGSPGQRCMQADQKSPKPKGAR